MYYTTIIKYVREGDKVTPVRVSQFNFCRGKGLVGPLVFAEVHTKPLDWAELYGNHTSWVGEQIKQRVSMQKSRQAIPVIPTQVAA